MAAMSVTPPANAAEHARLQSHLRAVLLRDWANYQVPPAAAQAGRPWAALLRRGGRALPPRATRSGNTSRSEAACPARTDRPRR